MQRFGLIARPVIIWSAKFPRECSRKVAHSRNSMVLAKSMFIFLNERSFFTFFAPLTCLDHIPFELLLFGPTRYNISEKIRALACRLFEISTVKVYVHFLFTLLNFKPGFSLAYLQLPSSKGAFHSSLERNTLCTNIEPVKRLLINWVLEAYSII